MYIFIYIYIYIYTTKFIGKLERKMTYYLIVIIIQSTSDNITRRSKEFFLKKQTNKQKVRIFQLLRFLDLFTSNAKELRMLY